MISIINNMVRMTRGDTLIAEISIVDAEGNAYTPEEGEAIRFALKHPTLNRDRTEFVDEDPLIIKVIPNDTLILKLDPEDTKDLGFGEYVYDVEITHLNGDADTFIAESPFILAPEVH